MVGILNERIAIMRLEFNPRALCYNLYCDTREEHDKMKQMLEKPLTATDVKSIDNMIYVDTDSIKTMKTKLNSLYGRTVMMNNNYIAVHVSDSPVVIFKQHIVAIRRNDKGNAEIMLVNSYTIITDEDYGAVVKLMF